MATMKKFKQYLINFIVLYLIVNVLVWLCIQTFNKENKINTEENYIQGNIQENLDNNK